MFFKGSRRYQRRKARKKTLTEKRVVSYFVLRICYTISLSGLGKPQKSFFLVARPLCLVVKYFFTEFFELQDKLFFLSGPPCTTLLVAGLIVTHVEIIFCTNVI